MSGEGSIDDTDRRVANRWLARNLAWSAALERWREEAAASSVPAVIDRRDSRRLPQPPPPATGDRLAS